jgi:hypothetical protein
MEKIRVAVVSAVFGGVDTWKPFCNQVLPEWAEWAGLYRYDETNTPVPLPNLPDRLKAKYFKTQCYRVNDWERCNADVVIWIDGNVEVKRVDFVEAMITPIKKGAYFTIQKHHERNSIKEEVDFILSTDNPYLLIRYGKQPLLQEHEYYIGRGMQPDAPLYSCNVFASKVANPYIESMLNEWWRLCLEWSWFDQSAFSYLASMDVDSKFIYTVDLGGVLHSPYFKLHSHDVWNK